MSTVEQKPEEPTAPTESLITLPQDPAAARQTYSRYDALVYDLWQEGRPEVVESICVYRDRQTNELIIPAQPGLELGEQEEIDPVTGAHPHNCDWIGCGTSHIYLRLRPRLLVNPRL